MMVTLLHQLLEKSENILESALLATFSLYRNAGSLQTTNQGPQGQGGGEDPMYYCKMLAALFLTPSLSFSHNMGRSTIKYSPGVTAAKEPHPPPP